MSATHPGLVSRGALSCYNESGYTQHRPLTSLTDHVSAANVARIHALLDRLPAGQRAALRLEEVDGEMHVTHWYVRMAAIKEG